jgi:hypothetical protein
MRPLRLGGAATRSLASWPTLRRRRSLHRPVKNRQCLRRIPVRLGGFCLQTTPAQLVTPAAAPVRRVLRGGPAA